MLHYLLNHKVQSLVKISFEELPPVEVGEIIVEGVKLKPMLGTMYPIYSSFSDNYPLSRVIPKVPAGTQIGVHMYDMLPTQPCLLVANGHPQD